MDQFCSTGFPYDANSYESIQKILIVGRQCWERLDNLLQSKGGKTEKVKYDKNVQPSEKSVLHISSLITEDSTDKNGTNESSLSSGTFTAQSFPISSSTVKAQTSFAQRSHLTPLEKCRLDNTKLRKVYQSRILHAKSPWIKANLSLEFHRKIAENISIAKAKEREHIIEQQNIEKKAMQQATRILSQSGQIRLTKLEDEKCRLYANILQYEEYESWPRNLRIRLASHPTDQAIIEEVVKTVLKRSDHPLAQWLHKKQKSTCEECSYLVESYKQHHLYLSKGDESSIDDKKLENGSEPSMPKTESVKNHLDEIINNVCNVCDNCMLMLGLMYEKLNESEIAQDISHRVVEDVVLGPIWQFLISLFRCINMQTEIKIAQTVREFVECVPKDFGLNTLAIDKSSSYDECAAKLKGILSITSPVQKLQTLVQAVQKLCECQRTGEDGSALTPTLLGADDLIPMLSYVLVQTGMPHLLSECQALERLLDQRYLLGEEGYCLTSCQMALQYLEAQADKLDS